jgi:hypothetical protein
MKGNEVMTANPKTTPEKQTTLATLNQLRARLYADAARAMTANPVMAEAIQKRTEADAARLAFAINMVQIKC